MHSLHIRNISTELELPIAGIIIRIVFICDNLTFAVNILGSETKLLSEKLVFGRTMVPNCLCFRSPILSIWIIPYWDYSRIDPCIGRVVNKANVWLPVQPPNYRVITF